MNTSKLTKELKPGGIAVLFLQQTSINVIYNL